MSRIFEALKLAQLFRSSKTEAKPPVAEAPEVPDRRKSRRWALDVAVYVYGHGPGREPFHEEAHTLNVSTNGALLLLSVPVQKGQQLLLTNEDTATGAEIAASFSWARNTANGRSGRGVSESQPRFLAYGKHLGGNPAALSR